MIGEAARVRSLRESVIRGMSRVAAEHGAINLAQGFPDFPAPEVLKEAAVRAIRADVNQYAITWGARRLREAVARKYAAHYGMVFDPETEVTITCGATEAMMAALLALLEPGDEVILFEPFYENYGAEAALCGVQPRYVPLMPGQPLDLDRLAGIFGPRTRAVIVNSPANPSGRVFDQQELEAIAALCQRHGAWALTDEIYEHIRYGVRHVPIGSLPGMRERTVTISGASKTFSITGWRIGTVVASAAASGAIRKVHDFLTVGAPAPLQEAVADAMDTLGADYYAGLERAYLGRRQILFDALVAAGFRATLPEGAYYILADYTGLSRLDDAAFALWLARERGVAAVPGSSFFRPSPEPPRIVRFAFCKSEALLVEAAARLAGGGGRGAVDVQR